MLKQLRDRGLLYSVGIVINRIVPEWLFRARIARIDRVRRNDTYQRKLDNLCTYRASTPEELRCASELAVMPLDRVTSTTTARIATIADEPLGVLWQATESFAEPELGIVYRLEPSQAWLFAANVTKSARGRGVYGELLDQTLSDPDHDYFVALNPTNRRTMKAHRQVSESMAGRYFAIRCMRIAFCVTTGSVRRSRTLSWSCHTEPIELSFR